MSEDSKGYTLQDWIETEQEDYELTQPQLDELSELLRPAIAKCEELNIPFTFIFQGALGQGGISVSLNGTAGVATADRVSPNIMLFNMMFMNREMPPDEALAHVSYAVQEKLGGKEEASPIIIP